MEVDILSILLVLISFLGTGFCSVPTNNNNTTKGTKVATSDEDVSSFMVLGDWGGLPIYPYRTAIERAVGQSMGKFASTFPVQFVLALGDNFYFDGVKDENDKRFQTTYEEVFEAESLQVPWYFLAGNHDHNGNVTAQIAYSAKSHRWKFPALNYTKVFSIRGSKSSLRLIMMDTVVACGNTQDTIRGSVLWGPTDPWAAQSQFQWIEDILKSAKEEYIIMAGHFPVWSIAEHGPTQCLLDNLLPLLDKYKVSAYFCGHDHNLQHLKPSNSSVEYFVIGAANFVDPSTDHADKVPQDSLKFHFADILSYGGFGYVTVSSTNMTFTFIDTIGEKDLYQRVLYPRKNSSL